MPTLTPTAWWPAAIVIVFAVLALFGSASDAAPSSTSLPLAERDAAPHAAATPEAVVAAVVTARGEHYAGDCATTRSPQDIGALCSRLVAERDGMRAYLLGRTFSEFGWWLFIAQEGAAWHAMSTAPLDVLDLSGTIPWPPVAVTVP